MLSRPAKIALGAAAAAGGLWWMTRDRRVAHAAPARLRGEDTIAARVSNAATVASEVSAVVGTHAKLAGRDLKRAGAEVADALSGDLKAVKVRDTPPLVGREYGDAGVDRTRNAAVVPPAPAPPKIAPARDFSSASSTYASPQPSRGRPYPSGSAAATGAGFAAPAAVGVAGVGDADAIDAVAMTHVPQVEDALGESAMAINATEGPGHGSVEPPTFGARASAHYGAPPAKRYDAYHSSNTASRGQQYDSGGYGGGASDRYDATSRYAGRPGVTDRAENAKDIVHDHATAAHGDVRQAKRELGDIGSAHGELMKRDLSTAGSEIKQALTGDRLPGGAVTRDTPDLLRRGARDEVSVQPTASSWSPEKRESPTLVDRIREAKDIVKAHGAAAVDDAKQWGHEVKEVVTGHGAAARQDVANAGREVKDAASGAIAPAAPLRTPSITADESKRF